MEIQHWLTVISVVAILVSPAVAMLVASWSREKNNRYQRQYEILYDVIRTRAATRPPHRNSDILEAALNSIPVVFSGNQGVIDAYQKFYESTQRGDSEELRTEQLVSLLLTISRAMGYEGIEESTIKNIMQVARG